MTDSFPEEMPESEQLNQSIFLLQVSKQGSINDSSNSLEIYQSYKAKVNEEENTNEVQINNIQDLRQSKPFSMIVSEIDKKDESTNKTFSIHYYNAQVQEQQFWPQNFPWMKRIEELQQEVEALRQENKELQKKVATAGTQIVGVSLENSKAEEESGTIQAENAEPIDYKSKYLQYKQKCRYLMNKLADLEAIMKQKK